MPTDPLAQKSAIYDQFLRGEIDAMTAARQIRALPWTSPALEYAPFAHGYSDQVLLQKLMQFNAACRALDNGPAA
jgi:hypothetical protein